MFGKLPTLLKEGKPAWGAWITIGNPESPEMLSSLGFDWLLFDLEHAPLDYQLLEYMLMSVRNDATPLVRVPHNNPVYVKKVLDMGAAGVLFPMVNSKEDALLAVRSTRYPPKGIRGVGPRRAAMYGLNREEYVSKADDVLVVVQIESKEAVDNAEEILSVEGVSAFFIGPNDLSFSLGYRSWKESPVRKAIEKVAEIGSSLRVPGGMYCWGEKAISFALNLGLRLIALGSDYRYLVYGASEMLKRAREISKNLT